MTSGCAPSNSPFTLTAGASLQVSCELQRREQWTGADHQRREYCGGGTGDLQGEQSPYQLLGDDGLTQRPTEYWLLAALVQQRRSGYPAQIWRAVILLL